MEKEISIIKLQPRKHASTMVTVPSEIIRERGLTKGRRLKVLLDKEKKRIIYVPID